MLVENQKVEVRWNNFTKKHYEDKGYIFTKRNDMFLVDVIDLPLKSKQVVKVKCDVCGCVKDVIYCNYNKYTNNGVDTYACENCKGIKIKNTYKTKNSNINYRRFISFCSIYDHIPISTVSDIETTDSCLKFICSKHGIQENSIHRMNVNHNICKWCSYELMSSKKRKTIEDVKASIESKNNNKLINPHEYVNRKKKNLKIQCGLCNNIFISSYENMMIHSGRCRDCILKLSYYAKNRLDQDTVKAIIESENENTWINFGEYNRNIDKNLKIKCGACGSVYNTSLVNYVYKNQTRCSICSGKESYGEFTVKKFLEERNISFVKQAKFDDCYDTFSLPFDFYLPDYNVCIEFDGKQHFIPTFGEESFYKCILHDGMKNNYCKWNNIKLIRIPYWKKDNIENILIKELNLKPINKDTKIKYIPNRKIA